MEVKKKRATSKRTKKDDVKLVITETNDAVESKPESPVVPKKRGRKPKGGKIIDVSV